MRNGGQTRTLVAARQTCKREGFSPAGDYTGR
jgi:hypothetical protein